MPTIRVIKQKRLIETTGGKIIEIDRLLNRKDYYCWFLGTDGETYTVSTYDYDQQLFEDTILLKEIVA